MCMKTIRQPLFLLLFLAVPASAIEVTYLGTTGLRSVGTNLLDPLTPGHEVRIGTLDPAYTPSETDAPGVVSAAWSAFGSTLIRELDGEPGRFGATARQSGDAFKGKPVWLWILRTEDGNAVNADFSNVVAHGLFRHSGWTFPTSDFPGLNRVTIGTNEIDTHPIGDVTTHHLALKPFPPADGLPGYRVWADTRLPAPESGSRADPDADGIINAAEFFFAKDPMQPEPSVFTLERNESGRFCLVFDLPDLERLDHLQTESTPSLKLEFQSVTSAIHTEPLDHGARVWMCFDLEGPALFIKTLIGLR